MDWLQRVLLSSPALRFYLSRMQSKVIRKLIIFDQQNNQLLMSSFIPQQDNIGMGFAISGLALICFSTYYRRTYSRILEAAQMTYLFAMIFTPTTALFSNKLGYSWLSFMPSFLNYCTAGDFSCTYGYLLSPSICWAAAALLSLIIIKIIGRCKPSVKFQPFYNFYKGLFRWAFGPLIYFATQVLITSLQNNTKDKDFLASAVVLGYSAAICFIELIVYTSIGGPSRMTKWNELFDHTRMALMVIMICVSTKIYSNAKYALYGPIVLFDLVYLITYNFVYKVFERVLFILSEAAFITLYTLFLTNSTYITTYNLDFFALALIILIEVLVILMRMCYKCNSKTDADSEINPEDAKLPESPRREISSPAKKNNRFIADADLGANISYEELNNSNSSPRKELYNSPKEKRRR